MREAGGVFSRGLEKSASRKENHKAGSSETEAHILEREPHLPDGSSLQNLAAQI
jgi:hypothetical protein